MSDPCSPDPQHAIVLYAARRVLLVLHAAGSIVLLGASTHHALQMRHYLRGRFGRVALEQTYAKVVAVAYVVTFALGAVLYPAYRYHVRGLYLDRHAPVFAALFDVKETYAALTLLPAIGLGVLALVWRPDRERHLVGPYAAASIVVCAVVWFETIVGLLVVSVRGVG